MFDAIRQRIAALISPRWGRTYGVRSYNSGQSSRLTTGWGSYNQSADAALTNNLPTLRGRSRDLIRNAGYAKRAKVIVVNNIIGTGIGLQAQVKTPRGKLVEKVNAAIEREWLKWCEAATCHTGGRLHFSDLERVLMGQVFEAGDVLLRKHRRAFGGGKIPFALELIESERLAEEAAMPSPSGDHDMRMGIEVDGYGRPVFFYVRERHPGDMRTTAYATDRLLKIPAGEIIHPYIIDRWPQTRGEPWMHAVAKRLHDMEGYSEAEIVAARGAASYMAFIKTPDGNALPADYEDGGERQINIGPGMVEQLPPGTDVVMNNPNRPNPNMDPFMRLMLREVAAGVGPSYESLSRDYSQSNYSSSRLALLDDRDLWRMLQGWYIRAVRHEIHREWLNAAVLSGAIPEISIDEYAANPERFQAAAFKPRGWGWIDPTKEVEAYKEAVKCGFTTTTDVIANTGGGLDIEDVLAQRERELQMMKDKGLTFETDPQITAAQIRPEKTGASEVAEKPEQESSGARVLPIRSAAE